MTDAAAHRRRGLELIKVSKSLRAARRQVARLRHELEIKDGMVALLKTKVEEANADERVTKMTASLKKIREQRDGTLAKNDRLKAELHELLKRITVVTKHGPGGTGASGPCDADCVKCRAEERLSR